MEKRREAVYTSEDGGIEEFWTSSMCTRVVPIYGQRCRHPKW